MGCLFYFVSSSYILKPPTVPLLSPVPVSRSFNFRRCPKEKMHEHPRSFLSDRDVCLLSSLLSKSQRTINRTRPPINARALPNPLQGTIPNRINILSKRASHAHARNSVKICQERQKTSLNGLGRRLKNFHLSQGVLITPTRAIFSC